MKGELDIEQCELSGKDNNENNRPGEKQLVKTELYLTSVLLEHKL